MTVANHIGMHRDHVRWLKENDLWRDDLRAWQNESEQVLEQMEELRKLFAAHEERLQKHAGSIRAYEQFMREHEHRLAAHEKGETEVDLISMAARHNEEAVKRAEQLTKHEAIKKLHHTMMANWHALLRSIRESQI